VTNIQLFSEPLQYSR